MSEELKGREIVDYFREKYSTNKSSGSTDGDTERISEQTIDTGNEGKEKIKEKNFDDGLEM